MESFLYICHGTMSLGLKRKEPEADHSIPFSAGVENAWSYLSGFFLMLRFAYIYLVRTTWEKFGLRAGNMIFNTQNEGYISVHINICMILRVYWWVQHNAMKIN
jgi:hypothetical protein